MKGYNSSRVTKSSQRTTKAKVLTVLNQKGAWTRVSSKSLDFYIREMGVTYKKEINEHRIEYFNSEDRCVMVYEF